MSTDPVWWLCPQTRRKMATLLCTTWLSWTEFKTYPDCFLNILPTSGPQEPSPFDLCMSLNKSLGLMFPRCPSNTSLLYPQAYSTFIKFFLHSCFVAFLIRNAVRITLPTILPQRSCDTHSTCLSKEFSFNLLLSQLLESPIVWKCDW